VRAKTIAAVRAAAAIVILCLAGALALPGGAVAKPGYYNAPGSSYEAIALRGSHGYSLEVDVFGRRAEVRVDKKIGRNGLLSAVYLLHRRLPAGPDIHFSLGKEGFVDLRFVSDRTHEMEYPNCTGGPEVIEKGHFVGAIRFRGRRDFTHVEAHRAKGTVVRTPPLRCRREKAPSGVTSVSVGTGTPGVPPDTLEMVAGTADRKLDFSGYRFEAGPATVPPTESFTASISRREPGLTASFFAFVFGGGEGESEDGFVSPRPGKPLGAAEIEPPAPFSGSATFALTSPHHAEWSGDLAVELPGYGRVPLTGPKIAAGLCETKACTPTLPKSLRPRTGGGAEPPDGSRYNTGSFFGG
jgi:hypothetical protein